MPFIDFSQQTWRPEPAQSGPYHLHIPQPYKDWLFDSGSLTKRLKSMSTDSFRVDVLHQGWAIPTCSEQQFLNCDYELANIREVLLVVDDHPLVFARSVLPASSLTGANRELLELGNQPLGEYLFRQSSMKRGGIEIKELPASQFNAHLVKPYHQESAWGRRSLFYLNDKPISVCEVFLPEYDV